MYSRRIARWCADFLPRSVAQEKTQQTPAHSAGIRAETAQEIKGRGCDSSRHRLAGLRRADARRDEQRRWFPQSGGGGLCTAPRFAAADEIRGARRASWSRCLGFVVREGPVKNSSVAGMFRLGVQKG